MVLRQKRQVKRFCFFVRAECFGAVATQSGNLIGDMGINLMALVSGIGQSDGGRCAAAIEDDLYIITCFFELARSLQGVDYAAEAFVGLYFGKHNDGYFIHVSTAADDGVASFSRTGVTTTQLSSPRLLGVYSSAAQSLHQ